MAIKLSEQQVLKRLDIPDFRHLTKDKAVTLVSMLAQIDPKVALKALDQYPLLTDLLAEEVRKYHDIQIRGLDSNDESNKEAMNVINTAQEVISGQLNSEDLSESERTALAGQLVELAKMASKKDSENKRFILEHARLNIGLLFALAGIAAAVLGVNIQSTAPNGPINEIDESL